LAIVGHWSSLAEAERLTQSHLVGGMIEENVKRGDIVSLLPMVQYSGLSAKWNRESTGPTTRNLSIGGQITWQSASTLTPVEVKMKQLAVATLLDDFVADTYASHTDYEAVQLLENKKSMLIKINDQLVYGDLTYSAGNGEPDGLHAIAQEFATNFDGDSLDIDGGQAALSLKDLRDMEDRMSGGIDFWLFPYPLANRLDAYMQEAGISTNTFGSISFTVDELGKRVMTWNGIPIIRTDYLVAEEANTGQGSNARAKNSSGAKQYSVFGIKVGSVLAGQGGLSYGFGGRNLEAGNLWKSDFFETMENQDASGIRLIHYGVPMAGATTAICRIHDVTDAAIVA
jgi:hypothetical protein